MTISEQLIMEQIKAGLRAIDERPPPYPARQWLRSAVPGRIVSRLT